MKKKLLLFSILFLPTSIWLFLELSTINSKKLPYYGPKLLNGADTVYYTLNASFNAFNSYNTLNELTLDTINYPLFAVSFVKQKYKTDNYRMAGLSEYIQFKKEKISEIPFLIITECNDSNDCFREFELLQTKTPTVKIFIGQPHLLIV
jgi:hypothetical protein